MRTVLLAALLGAVTLSGCFGSDEEPFTPGQGFEETGRTISLRMWVVDLLAHEVYPGFAANLWAFCAEALDPADEDSARAIEHWALLETDGELPANAVGKCSVPGPTLRVRQGDRVHVEFQNDHFHCHTIHWHGQHVPWQSDGAPAVSQDSVCQGQSTTYDFVAARAGTLWYHCHVDTQFHVMQGLIGAFIVEPQDDAKEPEDVDREYVVVLHTLQRDLVEATPARRANPHIDHQHSPTACGASGVPDCQNPAVDVTPDTYLINGRSYPYTMDTAGDTIDLGGGTVRMTGSQIFLREGERVRIRLVNAGETVETLHPHGHDVQVTHRDGNPLPAPFWVDTLTIGPAERYDLILEGDNPGPWMIHTHVASHEANDGQSPGGMHTMIVYEGFEDQMHQFRGELPGGRPYAPPQTFPGDLRAATVTELNGPDASFTWGGIVVEKPCAVRTIFLQVRADSSTPVTQLANELAVTIATPTGASETVALGSARFANWTLSPAVDGPAENGTYQVTVAGRAVSTVLELEAIVDYYNTIDEAAAANTCGLGAADQH